jgi:hypothetical protein
LRLKAQIGMKETRQMREADRAGYANAVKCLYAPLWYCDRHSAAFRRVFDGACRFPW